MKGIQLLFFFFVHSLLIAQVQTYTFAKGDSILSTYTYDPNAEVEIIVELREKPLALVRYENKLNKTSSVMAQVSAIEGEQARFKSDLINIEAELQQNKQLSLSSQIKYEYKNSINAVALKTNRITYDYIQSLPYVKKVHLNQMNYANDDESNAIINADDVWNDYDFTGDGIVIGIIDTGIDYNHPDLGGGIGADKKVIGGYDFVNQDNDPMDDNGHGTHVAGIAAANGVLKGVAPYAKLYALKVMNENGSGFEWDIIAAIEKALDLDGNPATDDQLDIINLSLGGASGSPTDALSLALENAIKSGIVCVVSAGNKQDRYFASGSPASCINAITVGSSTKTNELSIQSSFGPSRVVFGIKPDVIAPGDRINSTSPNNSYQALSGTSMAAPHVAGAAALLLEQDGTRTPDEIKGLLMQSASSIAENVFQEGCGLIDILKAVNAKSIAIPGSINFGIITNSDNLYIQTDTIVVKNISGQTQTYTIENTYIEPGITMNISSNTLSIPSMQSGNFIVQLTVDNSIFPVINEEVPAFVGNFRITSAAETLLIPYSFIKGNFLKLKFDTPPSVVSIYNSDFSYLELNSIDESSFDKKYIMNDFFLMPLQEGSYDVQVTFFNKFFHPADVYSNWVMNSISAYFLVDGINVSGTTEVETFLSSCTNKMDFNINDENGNFIPGFYPNYNINSTGSSYIGAVRIVNLKNGYSGSSAPHSCKEARYNSFSDNFLIEKTYSYYNPDKSKYFTVNRSFIGMEGDIIINSSPAEYKKVIFDYSRLFKFYSNAFPVSAFNNLASFIKFESAKSLPYSETYYLTPMPYEDFLQQGSSCQISQLNYLHLFSPVNSPINLDFYGRIDEPLIFETPGFSLVGDNEIKITFQKYMSSNNDERDLDPLIRNIDEPILMGLGPVNFYPNFSYLGNLYLKYPYNTYPCNRLGDISLFINQNLDHYIQEDVEYSLYKDGVFVETCVLRDKFNENTRAYEIFPAEAGAYKVEIPFNKNLIAGRIGTATAIIETNTNNERNSAPPVIANLNILSNGKYTDRIEAGNTGEIQIKLREENGKTIIVNVLHKGESDADWTELNVVRDGQYYTIAIGNTLTEGYHSLKFICEDNYNNKLTYLLEPGFLYGICSTAPAAPSELTLNTDGNGNITVSWNDNSTSEEGFIIERSANNTGQFGGIASTSANVTSFTDTDILNYTTYYYRIKSFSEEGESSYCTESMITSIEEKLEEVPQEFSLSQNYPNPFNPSTTIRFGLPENSLTKLVVYDILGRELETLVNREMDAGYHEVVFNAYKYSSGIYFYRIESGSFSETKKLVLLK